MGIDYDTNNGAGTAKETDPLLKPDEGPTRRITIHSLSFGPWLRHLGIHYNWKYLGMLFFGKHLLTGISAGYYATATPFLLKEYGIDGPHMQVYKSIAMIPWALKPVFGLLSDTQPICGYNKAYYLMFFALLGGTGMMILGLVPKRQMAIGGVVVCLICKSSQMAWFDLLIDAKTAEKIAKVPQYGPDLISYSYCGSYVFGIVAVLTGGPIIATLGAKYCFLFASIPALVVLFPVLAGYMDEQRQTAEDKRQVRQRIFGQVEVPVLVFVVFCCAILLSMTTLFPTWQISAIVSMCAGVALLLTYVLLFSPLYAKYICYVFLVTVFDFSTQGAAFYFYTDTPQQYKDGPHFSSFFYVSVLGTIRQVCSVLGVGLYNRYLKSWRYRNLYLSISCAKAFFAVIDMLVFARVTRKIGIPDHWCVLGLTIFEDFLFTFLLMSINVIFARLCPRGMEAIMTSFLASSYWLGANISANIGAWILESLHVQPEGGANEDAQFDNLWIASAISIGISFTAVVVLLQLVPDAKQTERIETIDFDVTSGSILRRYVVGERRR